MRYCLKYSGTRFLSTEIELLNFLMDSILIILRIRTVYWSVIISQTLCTIEYPPDYLWSPPFLLFVEWYSQLGTRGQDSYANQLFNFAAKACRLIRFDVLCYLCNHLNSVLVSFWLIFCIPVNLSIAFSTTFLPFFTFVQVIQCRVVTKISSCQVNT